MQTQNISFCDKTALNIKSNDVKRNILEDLDDIRIIEKHHEIFDIERHDKRLRKVPHLLSIRSNGNPYYMFFTKINFTNTIVMIDKKIQMGYAYPRMIITRFMFHDNNLFENTLLEGEMIKDDDEEWLYLISDMFVHKGKSVKELDLFKRIALINQLLTDNFIPSCHDIFTIRIKKYVPLNKALSFHDEFVRSLNYTCRGLYFKPLYSKFKDILFNFDNNKIIRNNKKTKYKSKYHFVTNEVMNNEHKTLVENKKIESTPIMTYIIHDEKQIFWVQKTETPDVYKLFDVNDNSRFMENACIDSLKTSKMLNNLFQNRSMLEKIKCECVLNKNKHLVTRWIPTVFKD